MKLVSARDGVRARNKAKKTRGFSKLWNPGDKLDIGFPIFWDENGEPNLMVATTWGHKLAGKELQLTPKKFHWPSHSEIDEETGQPVNPDVAYSFFLLGKALVEAQYKTDLKKIQDLNLPKDETTAQIRKLEKDYAVNEKGYIGKDPVVGKLSLLISTECVVVKLRENDEGNLVPDVKNQPPVLSTFDLSNQVIKKIHELMDEKKFRPKEGDNVFWVRFSFSNDTDRGQASKNKDILGIEPQDLPLVKYQKDAQKIKDALEQMPTDSEMIANRNTAFAKGDEDDLRQALSTYFMLNEHYFKIFEDAEMDQDDEKGAKRVQAMLGNVAKTVVNMGISPRTGIIIGAVHDLQADEAKERVDSFEKLNFKSSIEDAIVEQEDHDNTDLSMDIEDLTSNL